MGKFIRYYDRSQNDENISKEHQIPNPKIITKVKSYKKKVKSGGKDITIAKKSVKTQNNQRKFKSRDALPEELLDKYTRGPRVDKKDVRTAVHQMRIENIESKIKFAVEQLARTEILLTEDHGYLEADDGETTTQFTQKQITSNVDITAASKHFDLKLLFGPYRAKYTINGRHLLLGGKKGHVAAFDWVSKKLHCELNVMESVHDVSWLHIETMFAVAQKNWVYIYDNQGIELHCVKRLNKVSRLEFLPYHFLLAACSDEGYLSWLDVSIGKLISHYNTSLGRLSLLSQNPWNGVLCVGHAKGVVSMWAPNSREPLVRMLCHKAPMSAIHIDPKGVYMATAASNRELKIWDVRKLEGPVQEYKLITAANNLAFSQKNMLAVSMGNVVEVYRNISSSVTRKPYIRNRFVTNIGNANFCPYEDVLGVTTAQGFTSLLVPGSGEPNYDALEANPFQTKSQRREAEVKALLEKIQPELITLDPTNIAEVHVPTLREKLEAKEKLLYVKAPKINYEQRNKMKGKGGSVQMVKNKKIVQEQAKKEFVKSTKGLIPQPQVEQKTPESLSVLDRFLPKNKIKNKM